MVLSASALPAQDSVAISDNSFLIEEAYNQEPGVVQHISTFALRSRGAEWTYALTQEWPIVDERFQLSYTVPVEHADGRGTGIGDVALSLRRQVLGSDPRSPHFSPRLTVLLPTGSASRGRGAGGAGWQVNLPFSLLAATRLALHLNAGATVTPSARDAVGARATTVNTNLGGSVIWLAKPTVNVLLEFLWLSEAEVTAPSRTRRAETVVLNPGVRWAINFSNGLQIVPGVAYAMALSRGSADHLFLYLSFEHPFRHR